MTGRTVLLWLVGFFVVVFAVNAVLVRAAISTFGGVETLSSYKAGLQFEHGSRPGAAPGRAALAGERQALRATARARRSSTSPRATRTGAPLAGLTADARLAHPADDRRDHVIAVRTGRRRRLSRRGAGAAGAMGTRSSMLYRGDERLFRSRSRVAA